MTKKIPLTKGYVALVDDEDYDFLMRFKWSVVIAGPTQKHVYARRAVMVNGEWHAITMHRLVAGAPHGVEVDHRNGNTLDNTRENLRLCSRRQNAQNCKPHKGVAYKGVNKSGSCTWAAHITSGDGGERATHYLGAYDTAEAAARVFDAAARLLYGSFARGNFSEIDPDAHAIAARVLEGGRPPERDRKTRRLVSDAQALELRQRYAAGECSQAQLAAEYGLKVSAVSHIITGRTFKDIPNLVTAERRKQLHRQRLNAAARPRQLTDEQVTQIRERFHPHVVTAPMLAAEFGVSVPCVYKCILQGRKAAA